MSHLTFLQAIVIGAVQGISELFPILSLGHSVLVPALIGGSWRTGHRTGAASLALPGDRDRPSCGPRPGIARLLLAQLGCCRWWLPALGSSSPGLSRCTNAWPG